MRPAGSRSRFDDGVRSHASAEAVAAEQIGALGVLMGAFEGSGHGVRRHRLGIHAVPTVFLEREVVAQRRDADASERLGDGCHAAVAHIGAGAVAEGQRGAMFAIGRAQQGADFPVGDWNAQCLHQLGSSSALVITVPTSPYSTDSSTLIQ